MNEQGRAKPDFSKMNPLHGIEIIKGGYRGYNNIIFLRPFANAYMGYLDDDFFGFTVPEEKHDLWLMESKQAIDYYLDKTFFHIPQLEFDTFLKKDEYRIYVNALALKKKELDKKKE